MSAGATPGASDLTDLAFERAGVGLCLVGHDGTIVRVNGEWLRSTGFTREQVIGREGVALFPARRDMAPALHERARAGHRVEVPRHAQLLDGRETWWEGSIEPVPMNGGTGLLVTARELGSAPPGRSGGEEALGAAIAALDEERRRFAAVLDALPAGVAIADATGRITHFNAALERIWGNPPIPRSAEEYREWRGWWLDTGERLRADEWAMARALSTGEVAPGDVVEIERFDGSGRAVIINAAAPIRNAQGQVVGGVLAEVDITQQKRAEEALAAERERYRALFQHSVDAVYLARADGTILDANPAACQLHGMTVDEIREAGRARLVVNDDRHAAALKARASTGQVRAEMTVRRKDGSTVPVEVESVLLDASTPDSAAFVISRDISARKRAEEELRENLARSQRAEVLLRDAVARYERQVRLFDKVASATPDFVYVFDLQGRFLYANRGLLEVWGMQLPDVTGKTCRELGYEQWHHDMHMREIAQVIETKRPIKGEVPFKAPLTGIFGVYEYIFTPVLGPDGEVEMIAGTTRDVTERRRAQEALVAANEKLQEADRRKDEFLGMLSHELRNPLAPIRNSIFIIGRAAPASEQARRAHDVIVRQTEHLTRLVDDLLDVTRISRAKVELRRARVDLRDVVRRTAEDFHSALEDRGVTFRTVVPDAKVWADADPTRIAQVIGNLLHNAVKFTRGGDEVTLSLHASARAAEIRVRDTGEGVDPALLPRVFDPFVQGERTLARAHGGLGLGLALVKGIAELHGGSVSAESAGSGKGAQFTVTLPLADGPLVHRADASHHVRRANGGRRVLIVDDNADAAESLADIVGMLGHTVEVAYDGKSAIERARARPPDVVFCDIGLPGMTGYEVARALRDGRNGVQLFAVSGYAQPDDVRRALEAGFDGHLAKPVDVEELERLLA